MIIFNGYDFSNDIRVTNINRSLLPPISVISSEIVGRAGSIFQKKKIQAGVIPVDFVVVQNTLINLRTKARYLAGKLNTEEPKELYFKDEPDKYIKAIVSDNTSLEETLAVGQGTINFYCPEPIYFGNLVTEVLTNGDIYTNEGTYEAKGIITITITSNVSYLEVTSLKTGEFIYLEDNFVVGDVIEIDLTTEKVTKNGNSIMTKVYLTSDFFSIPVGDYEINISNGNGSLVYESRWL
jgi:predicted phage tail component-like protein